MNIRLGLFQKALVLVIVPLVFEAAFVTCLWLKLEEVHDQMQRGQLFVTGLNTAVGYSLRAAQALFQYSVKSDPKYLLAYRADYKPVEHILRTLRISVQRNNLATPESQAAALRTIDALDSSLKEVNELIEESLAGAKGADEKELSKAENPIRRMSRLSHLPVLFKRLLPSAYEFGSGLGMTEDMVRQQELAKQDLQKLILAGMAVNVLIAILLAIYFSKSTVRRLNVVMDNTRLLALDQPLNPPVEGSDEITHLDRVFADMAVELDAARRKERAIIENAADVICSLDSQGRFTTVSPACRQFWGYEPPELIGRLCAEIVVPEDRETLETAIDRIRQAGPGKVESFETRTRHRDEQVIHVLWSAQWGEKENALFCVAHDISARKEIERLKQEFVSMISHDLRTPLASIQGFLNNLVDGAYGPLAAGGEQKAATAERSASRLIKLINDLLDTERMETGLLPMDRSLIHIDAVIQHAMAAVQNYAEQSEIALAAEPTDAVVFADPEKLEQVLINLLGNAIKFSPAGSTVDVQTVVDPSFVEVRVRDRGRGVPPSMREAIFERFRQVDAGDPAEKMGSGLGLAICKAIVVLQHGGQIGVNSEVGRGSTFWFRLPAAPPAQHTDEVS